MKDLSISRIGSIFADALAEVVATTTGFSFDTVQPESGSGFDELIGFIGLNGNNQGIVFISASESTMRIICSYMTGISENELKINDLEDGLCELVNMTAGSAKLRFNSTDQTYTLSPPFLLHGRDINISTKKRVQFNSWYLGNENISLKLKLVFY